MIHKNHPNRQPFVNSLNNTVIDSILFIFFWCIFTFVVKMPAFWLWTIAVFAIVFIMLPRFVMGWLQNQAVKFYFDDRQITVKRGVLNTFESIINYKNVTNITVEQNTFDMMFDQGQVSIWTFSDYPDVILYLDKKDAEFLRNHIMGLTK